jgi:hypothetical protein
VAGHTATWLAAGLFCASAADAAPVRVRPDFDRRLHVVYFSPAGREPAEGYRERLDRIVTDVQAFYREEMERSGHGPMTFPLDRDGDGRLVVHLARSEKRYSKKKGPGGQEVRGAARAALSKKDIDIDRNHVVIFQNLIWVEGGNRLTPRAPYTGWGNHVRGTACVTDHAILDPGNYRVRDRFVVDRGNRQSWGRYNVIQIGGVAHELGHSFGLPHNRETPEEKRTLGTALMGGGNYTYRNEVSTDGKRKGSFITKAHALALSTHPLFRRDDRERDAEPECELAALSFRQEDDSLVMIGTVKSSLPLVGVTVYNDELPTGTNRDYDAASAAAGIGRGGAFLLSIGGLRPKEYHLSLRVYHSNGYWRTYHFPYRVEGRPIVPVAKLNRTFLYTRVRAAFDRRDRARMWEALADLAASGGGEDDDISKKARALDRRLRAWEALSDPARVPDDVSELMLSDARWRSAKVGWFEPSYDRVVTNDAGHSKPLESGSRRHDKGIYAHAPSRYVYALAGGWKRLSGLYGLQKGSPGSVVFVVRGDGRELFRSEVVRDFGERELKVAVSGVAELELVVETTDDGPNSDWGIWFGPRLTR